MPRGWRTNRPVLNQTKLVEMVRCVMQHKRFEVSGMHRAIQRCCCFSVFNASSRLNINRTRSIPASHSTVWLVEASIAGIVRRLRGVSPSGFFVVNERRKKGQDRQQNGSKR